MGDYFKEFTLIFMSFAFLPRFETLSPSIALASAVLALALVAASTVYSYSVAKK